MSNGFWEILATCKEKGKWIELSRDVHLDTVHHSAFPGMEMKMLYDYARGDGFRAHEYRMPSQYGTHIDPPLHMSDEKGAGVDVFTAEELILPLCVIHLQKEVEANPDYGLSVADIEKWESENGKIPEGAFVAFQSGWGTRETYAEIENRDAEGVAHYPGWTIEALTFLLEERNITAIGHEPADTDPAVVANTEGWIAERYWLGRGCYQVELMINLDKCPATGGVIIVGFPKIIGGAGSTARCFALVPKE